MTVVLLNLGAIVADVRQMNKKHVESHDGDTTGERPNCMNSRTLADH